MPSGVKLVLDWDGTVTEQDTLELLLLTFGDPQVYERTERGLEDGTMSYRDVMEAEMATIRIPLGRARDYLLEHVRVRSGFRELAERRRPLILSSGFAELIDPLLDREGVRADVVANSVDARPDGWRVVWKDEAPCPECDDHCKRFGLPDGPFVYAGDGYSDRCPALLAERVFATGGLARFLEAEGRPFEPLTDFRALDRALG